jgi:hypothetical protein
MRILSLLLVNSISQPMKLASTQKKDLISLDAARLAELLRRLDSTAAVVVADNVKCMTLFVSAVAKTLRLLSNLVATSQFTATNVSIT